MDQIDQAEQSIELVKSSKINEIRKQTMTKLPYTGFCHYCDEPVKEGALFCDANCAEDYDWYQKLKKQKLL